MFVYIPLSIRYSQVSKSSKGYIPILENFITNFNLFRLLLQIMVFYRKIMSPLYYWSYYFREVITSNTPETQIFATLLINMYII